MGLGEEGFRLLGGKDVHRRPGHQCPQMGKRGQLPWITFPSFFFARLNFGFLFVGFVFCC